MCPTNHTSRDVTELCTHQAGPIDIPPVMIEDVQSVDSEESLGKELRSAPQSIPMEVAGIVIDDHARPCTCMWLEATARIPYACCRLLGAIS